MYKREQSKALLALLASFIFTSWYVDALKIKKEAQFCEMLPA
jgi:hypothetical protein